jgi:hypothetical protein
VAAHDRDIEPPVQLLEREGVQRKSPGPPDFPRASKCSTSSPAARTPAGKREIARAFGLTAQEKIALKALLKDMADEGLIDSGKAAPSI